MQRSVQASRWRTEHMTLQDQGEECQGALSEFEPRILQSWDCPASMITATCSLPWWAAPQPLVMLSGRMLSAALPEVLGPAAAGPACTGPWTGSTAPSPQHRSLPSPAGSPGWGQGGPGESQTASSARTQRTSLKGPSRRTPATAAAPGIQVPPQPLLLQCLPDLGNEPGSLLTRSFQSPCP